MSLKPTTLKLLTFLYSTPAPIFGSYEQISLLLPQLSAAGARSLVSHLVSQGLIATERLAGKTLARLTQPGQRLLEQQFPAFSITTGDEYLIIFLQPPKTDPQFRYLRQLLIQNSALALSRGVYLTFPTVADKTATAHSSKWNRLVYEVENSYSQSLLVVKIGEWKWGDSRQLIANHFHLFELANSYSGISKEITQLLKQKQPWSSLTHPQKQLHFSVFNRLYSLIQKDPGLLNHYVPQVETAISILSKWQRLISDFD